MDEQEKPERDGATRRNDGRWMGRITLADGKRKAVYGASKTAVLKKIHKLQADQDAGLPIISDRRTVAQFLNEWLETVRTPALLGRAHLR